MAYGMNNEVRVVAREKCRHSHLTHLAKRQDKAEVYSLRNNHR
jgi:hypothetical protein